MLDQQLLEHARSVWREFAERCAERRVRRLEAMNEHFKDFMEDLLNYPLVRPWRESLDMFQEHYFQQPGVGMRLTPESYEKVAALIERHVNDPRCGAYGPVQPDATGIPPTAKFAVAVASPAQKYSPQGESPAVKVASTKSTTPAAKWPALSEEDRERNRKGVGIPWWWPIQPTGPFDDDWERRFEELGRRSKDLLLAVYQELAAAGKLARGLEDQDDADLTPLAEQSAKAQTAFDAYQYSVVQFRRKWVACQYETQFIAIHVFALVERIDAALPTRIEGLKSRFDRELADAARQSTRAGRLALSRAEGAYRELRFVDWAVTAVEIITLLGAIRATATKVAIKALAEGATESAARNLAIKYTVKQLVVQTAIAAGAQAVVPPILSSAGLDENEIRAGLAIVQALQTLAALKTLKAGAATPKELPEKPAPGLPKGIESRPGITNPANPPTRQAADAARVIIEHGAVTGSFSIVDWSGYPAGAPRPQGPFRLIEGAEYQAARNAANAANRAMHRREPSIAGMRIHEIHPVKFGGSPTDPGNKIALSPEAHQQLTNWWNAFMRRIQGD